MTIKCGEQPNKLEMKSITFFAIAFSMLSSTLCGQSTTKCDMAKLLDVSKNVGKVTHQEMVDFLLTFGEECQNNVEYSEWSNELLFELLDKQTELIVKTIAHQTKVIELAAILKNLEEPIQDRFNLKAINDKVEKVKFDPDVKKEIINRLKIAESKTN